MVLDKPARSAETFGMTLLWPLLAIVGLTIVNGFFSGAEIAVLSVRKTRLQELAERGNRAAEVALALRDDPERFLATVQIGITVVGATAGAFGGSVLEEPIAAWLRTLGVERFANQIALAGVVMLVSVLSVVVGELVPKSLALRSSERLALVASRPMHGLSRLGRPIVWFLTVLANMLLRLLPNRTDPAGARLSPDELQQMVEEAAHAGTVTHDTGTLASRAIELGALHTYSLMIPRSRVAWLPVDASREATRAALRQTPHARYPVLGPEEQIAGYVLAHDLYEQLLGESFELRRCLRDVPVFPERMVALQVLRELQASRSGIGVTIDEHGAFAGLISVEQLVEEVFGAIVTEHESVTRKITPLGPKPAGPGGALAPCFLVHGDTPLHELNRELDLELPIHPEASTLAGLVVATHGSIPLVGARVELVQGICADVIERSPRAVIRIRLQLLPRHRHQGA